MKLKLYLDTSVFNALLDPNAPERQSATLRFWGHLSDYAIATSDVTVREIKDCPDPLRRGRLLALLEGVTVIGLTSEMQELAERYVRADVFTTGMMDDALHVAAAVLSRQDVIVAWNFRHLVNRRRRALVNDVNVSAGLPSIDIVSPPEM